MVRIKLVFLCKATWNHCTWSKDNSQVQPKDFTALSRNPHLQVWTQPTRQKTLGRTYVSRVFCLNTKLQWIITVLTPLTSFDQDAITDTPGQELSRSKAKSMSKNDMTLAQLLSVLDERTTLPQRCDISQQRTIIFSPQRLESRPTHTMSCNLSHLLLCFLRLRQASAKHVSETILEYLST